MMSEQSEVVKPSENQSGFPTYPEVAGNDADFQKDIQAIAKEQGITIGEDGKSVDMSDGVEPRSEQPVLEAKTDEPTAPSQPEPEEVKAEDNGVEVPKKFQDPDGNLDQSKLDKSFAHAQATLEKYAELEKELKRKQNEVGKAPQMPEGIEPGFEGFAKQIEDTIRNEGTGAALAKLFQAAQDSALQQMESRVASLSERTEIQERKGELQKIAEQDPQVYTQEGYDILAKVRQENPHLNSSPNPWTQAYYLAKGMGYLNSSKPHNGQVMPTPSPKGAPATPPSGARREDVQPTVDPNAQNIGQLLDKLTPEQEDAFWAKQGFPGMKRTV